MLAPTAGKSDDLDSLWSQMFPLPLTTIESFMFLDAVPEYPMMADLELHFQGSIDRAAFGQAMSIAMARAPLFRSVVQQQGGKLFWTLTDQQPEVDWAPIGTSLGPGYDSFIDLTQQPALRVWVRHGEDRSTVRLHFHHACSDGIGGFAFIEDFLAAYARSFPHGQEIPLRPLEPQRLRNRGNPGTGQRSIYRGFKDTLTGAREGLRFFLQRPVRLASHADTVQPEFTRSGFITRNCPDNVTAGLRQVASVGKVSVNDLLLRDLFLTLRKWNTERGHDPGRRNVRILMPQNLRERADKTLPVTNLVGFAFVTRQLQEGRCPSELLHSISEETTAVRQGQLSRYFLGGLGAIESAGCLERLLRSSTCFSTAILTNLGDPLRRFVTRFPRSGDGLAVGNLVFQRVEGVPPLRPGTRAAFCIYKDRRSLSMSVKCDPNLFSPEDTDCLTQMYLEQLARTATG